MNRPRALIVRTAGTNCDRETVHAFRQAGAEVEEHHLNRLLAEPDLLGRFRILVLPGGFTYGDDLGAGTLFANRLRATLLSPLLHFVDDGGLILGICNGFQILVKAGLLPALDGPGSEGEATLAPNDSDRFEERWITIEAESDRTPFVTKGDRIHCPAAHGEGKFVPRNEETLRRLEANGQIVFRYVGERGEKNPPWPANPSGSTGGVAGVCDPTGRILGLMPHPERNCAPAHDPHWPRRGLAAEGGGLFFFRNAVAATS